MSYKDLENKIMETWIPGIIGSLFIGVVFILLLALATKINSYHLTKHYQSKEVFNAIQKRGG